MKFRLGLKSAICNYEDESPFKWLINKDTRDTDKYIWNTPSMWCLAGGQTGRTLVFSLETTFKWLFHYIYNLFNPDIWQRSKLSHRKRRQRTWNTIKKADDRNHNLLKDGIDSPAATQICNRSRKRNPWKRALTDRTLQRLQQRILPPHERTGTTARLWTHCRI